MVQYKDRDAYPVSVDSVVFGYAERKLMVALIQRKKTPFKGLWAIPGGFVEGKETVEETARRELEEETGIRDIYLEQFHVFNKPGRDPRGLTLTVAFFALINSDQLQLVATDDALRAKWWPAYQIPPLAFDHDQIYVKALESLRIALKNRPVAFELLPPEFTLTQLQELYEQVFNITLDKRNFRKKIHTLEYIQPTGKKGGRRRPAMLYRYDPKRYISFTKANFF